MTQTTEGRAPLVGIVMGSQSDWDTMRGASEVLAALDVACEVRIVSAHRTPDRLFAYAEGAAGRGLRVVIAGAGGAAHLPGMIAAKTRVPVLGVPVQSKALSGMDSLLSIVQMPKGIPVGTLAIGPAGAANAGLLAAAMLATTDAALAGRLDAWRAAQTAAVAEAPMTSDGALPRIGILGGGQLGRMLAVAASRLGFEVEIFEPGADPCAGQVAKAVTRAGYDDIGALRDFAARIDVATYEFENVPLGAIDALAEIVPVRPGRRALEVSQDRIVEKDFLTGIGLATAPYAALDDIDDLRDALARIGVPAILKTRRFGYDGKGQTRVTARDQAPAAWESLGGTPSVLEGFVSFEREISVIAARGLDGQVVAFDPGENVHDDGILRTTTVPAAIPNAMAQDAVLLAGRILNALDYVGVMGVELFVTATGLVVNEIAPRVHNSGHWTQDGCLIDQFEQHIRAIVGWPLGDGARHSDAVMTNLIGEEVFGAAGLTGAGVHVYGKGAARPGRKMGHFTRITPRG